MSPYQQSKFTNTKSSTTDHDSDINAKKRAAYAMLAASIEKKILSYLGEARIKISNESAHHAKHLEGANYLVSHLKIMVVSNYFDGISRLNRHRLFSKILGEEFKAVHSITLSLLTTEEAQS